MRALPVLVTVVGLALLAGCGETAYPISIADARSQLSSPKPQYYLFQTIGGGVEVPGEARTVWLPLTAPDDGKRIVIRYGEDERLEHAAVMTAGPDGRFDQVDEVLFDRALWRQSAQTSRP